MKWRAARREHIPGLCRSSKRPLRSWRFMPAWVFAFYLYPSLTDWLYTHGIRLAAGTVFSSSMENQILHIREK